MPFVWCLGSIIGPAVGGALAMPCEAYPWLFPKGTVFDKYPFLLPNLVCVIVLVFGIGNGLLFLEETHAEKKHRRDFFLKLGDQLLEKVFGIESVRTYDDKFAMQIAGELEGLTIDDPPPGYRSTEGSPRMCSTPVGSIASDLESVCREKENRGVFKTFNRQIILIIVGYAILAYHSVSFDALMPTFLSEERTHEKTVMPFKFSGGFAMSTKTIGFMMAVQGVYSMIAQLWLFPFVVRRFGTLISFRLVMTIWPLLYFAVPYLVLLPERLQTAGIYFCLLAKITFHVIAFPSNAILLTNAAHSKSVLGTINGVAASTACLARAFGPTVTGSIHSAGLKLGYNGLAWWAGGLVCTIGALESYWMEETEGRVDRPIEEEEQPLCEPLLHAPTVEANEEHSTRRDSLASLEDLDLSMIKA